MLNHGHQLSSNQNFTANLTALQKKKKKKNSPTIFLCATGGGAKSGGWDIMFYFRKTKIEITSPYTSPWFLSQKAANFLGLQHSNNTTRGGHHSLQALHFIRCTMTAFRRFACCSVLLSSDSSLLGKVVIRTKSIAAIEGRAATTKCRRSDTLKDTRQHVKQRRLPFYAPQRFSVVLVPQRQAGPSPGMPLFLSRCVRSK